MTHPHHRGSCSWSGCSSPKAPRARGAGERGVRLYACVRVRVREDVASTLSEGPIRANVLTRVCPPHRSHKSLRPPWRLLGSGSALGLRRILAHHLEKCVCARALARSSAIFTSGEKGAQRRGSFPRRAPGRQAPPARRAPRAPPARRPPARPRQAPRALRLTAGPTGSITAAARIARRVGEHPRVTLAGAVGAGRRAALLECLYFAAFRRQTVVRDIPHVRAYDPCKPPVHRRLRGGVDGPAASAARKARSSATVASNRGGGGGGSGAGVDVLLVTGSAYARRT